jgi:glucose dehydrogenase
MVGTTGTGVAARFGGPQLVGLDATTGKELWRIGTIARPGEPGGDSWNGVPFEQRSGASIWTPGSYDPDTGLAYFGTGNTYDTGPLLPLKKLRFIPTRRWRWSRTPASWSGTTSTFLTTSGTWTGHSSGSW